MKCSVFIASSLDGYIAREDGGLDWLPGFTADQDYGYKRFIETVDCIVMGRGTFDAVIDFQPWPYNRPVYVLTSRPLDLPDHLADKVSSMSGPPADVRRRLAEGGRRHAYIDGGATIQQWLRAGLIDNLTITTIPVLLGSGRPLFGKLDRDIHLHVVESHSFEDGLVQSTYTIGGKA
jgi:dihydrofolate reductase